MSRVLLRLCGLSFCLLAIAGPVAAQNDTAPTPQDVFNRRILPIFRSPEPSSCVQCHLAAVDLKDYILSTPEATFVSLRDQGLIDLDKPRQSKLLSLIRMGENDLDTGARLVHEKVREAEYEAFVAWIEACSSDPKLRALEPTDVDRAGPDRPDEVIRHARRSRIVDSFARNVWSQRLRCFPCHTPHEIDAAKPAHQAAVKTLKGFAEKYDAEFLERLKLFRETPEKTLDLWIARSRQPRDGVRPLLNLEAPRESLLLLKPMSKPPQGQRISNVLTC
ncbi:MAG: hypothetical protein AB7U20_20280 [Planctomycetaceae bacterium]